MKFCSKCGQWKIESDFYKDKNRSDGLTCWCKICKNELTYKARGKVYKPKPKPKHKIDVLGGYKITILNYAKPNEYKYIIIPTNGESFMTNNNIDFMKKIKELING